MNTGDLNTDQLGSINRKIVADNESLPAVPTLGKVGLFDLFSAEEWVNGNNPGRKFVGKCAVAYLAEQN